MPRLSVWLVRLALVYLLAGFSLGALLLAHKGVPFWPTLWRTLPAHVEFLLLGWMAQLALGVAYWILPRFSGGSRGNTRLAVAAGWLLNTGVLLVAAQPFAGGLKGMATAGRGLELLAAGCFALHAWPRVKAMFSRP